MPHINFKNCSSVFVAGLLAFAFAVPTFAATQTCPPGSHIVGGRGGNSCVSDTSGNSVAPQNTSAGTGAGTFSQPTGNGTFNSPSGNGCGVDSFLTGGCKSGNTGTNGNTFGGSETLQNPLRFNSFAEFFNGLLHIIVIFAIPIIILMIIYSGFLYVMARGNEEQVTKATRSLTYAVLGGLIILGAELILQVIQGTVSQLTI